jgi:hypothetical protein
MKMLNKDIQSKWLAAGVAVCMLAAAGCATAPAGRNTAGGAGLGALLGAGAGAVAGNNIDGLSKTEGAVAGALVGGLLGGVMGNQKDAMVQQNESVNQRMNAMGQEMNTTVVNVTNTNGSTTPVVLHKSANQWLGPRGELYPNLPTPDQLRPVYGF